MTTPDDESDVISPLRFVSSGLEFALVCTGAALLGQWADARLGTSPWLLTVLLVLGFASATWLLLRSLSHVDTAQGDETK